MAEEEKEPAREYDPPLPLGEHLEELRKRLFKCVAVFIIAVAVCLYFQDTLMHVVTRPHVWAMRSLSKDLAAKRQKELAESDPYKLVRKMLAKSERQALIPGEIHAVLTAVPEPHREKVGEALDKYNTAERRTLKSLALSDLLAMNDAQRDVEMALLEVHKAGEIENLSEFIKAETAIYNWTDISKGTPGALREYLKVLDEQRDSERRNKGRLRLRVLKYQESFITYLKLAIICALFVVSPFTVYQIWGFVSVGLYRNERSVAYFFGPSSLLLFSAGVLFGYFVLIRLGLTFLAGYGNPELVESSITLGFYLSLFMLLTMVVGLTFELPLIMYALARIGLVSPKSFSNGRRYFFVLAFVFAALLTPPDVITQVLLGIPMIILYELGIILAKLAYRKDEYKAAPAGEAKK